MKPLIIYHGPGCMDGAAAALAAWLKFGEDAEYRPAQYGDSAPTDEEIRGRDVFVLDFSYPRAELERINAACLNNDELAGRYDGKLVILDHHRTAQKDCEGLPFCTFDMTKSGAVLAWEHFNTPFKGGYVDPNGMMPALPELFAYVQDRDLWQWKLPHSREVSAALAASGALTDFRKLIPIFKAETPGTISRLAHDGAAILHAERLMVERIVASAEEVDIRYMRLVGSDGTSRSTVVRCLAATSAVLQSEVGEALALESARRGRDAVGAVYYKDGKAGKWRVSLRSRDVTTDDQNPNTINVGMHTVGHVAAPDVSAVAKSFGGGGHARAAGFECERLPWLCSVCGANVMNDDQAREVGACSGRCAKART